MTHLFALGLKVEGVVGVFLNVGLDALDDAYAALLEGLDLFGVICDEPYGGYAEELEDLGGKLEVAAVGGVAQLKVGFDGVASAVLEFVGLELGHEADAAAFLVLVEENAGTGIGDGGEGELELLAAVAAQRVEDVAGEAL